LDELRQRLEEKNKLIEKKTHHVMMTGQERNKLNGDLQELREHIELKDRKIAALQRKVSRILLIKI
jgi:chromosome segregation ATPase